MSGSRADSRLISRMKEQLQRMKDRRAELEEEEAAADEPIVPHLTRIMRDRQSAEIRSMVRRNLQIIDHDIQEAVGRLGAAILDPVSPDYPDLIPRQQQQQQQPAVETHLPPSRQLLLGAVKESLESKRKNPSPPPRVALYQFRHQSDEEETLADKMRRLSVRQLPSVTIASPRSIHRSANQIVHVQSPSSAIVDVSATPPPPPTAIDIQPDDVARIVSDIMASQIELAVDSFQNPESDAVTSSNSTKDRSGGIHQDRRITIDTFTQTKGIHVKDSSTGMAEASDRQDRGVGTDPPSDPDETMEEEDENSSSTVESLTPPRAGIDIRADPDPPPALDLWRRRYPATPPSSSSSSSCSEKPIRLSVVEHDPSIHPTKTGSISSSSISSGSISIDSSGSAGTGSGSATAAALSWLSEGEVPNRVASPGQVTIHPSRTKASQQLTPTPEPDRMEGSMEDVTLSVGQIGRMIINIPHGSSEGEVFLARSDSTASFRSATGSLGEIQADPSATTDGFQSE